MLTFSPGSEILFVRGDSPRAIERKAQNMTDLIKALSVALDRLSSIEETMNRLDRHSEMISRFNDRLDRFEARLTKAETKSGNVDVCIDEICALERKVHKLGVETHDQITVNHEYGIRIQTLEGKLVDMDTMDTDHADLIERLDERVDRIKDRVLILEENGNGSEDLDDRVGEILDRKLDHVLEDMLDSALSGREITVTL